MSKLSYLFVAMSLLFSGFMVALQLQVERSPIPLGPVVLNEQPEPEPLQSLQDVGRVKVAPRPPVELAVMMEGPVTDACAELKQELAILGQELRDLKAKVYEHRNCEVVGPLSAWLRTLWPDDVRPTDAQLLRLRWTMEELDGVILTRAEGLWLIEREALDDWKNWGVTYTQALVTFLGYPRLVRELTPEALVSMAAELENW